MRILLSLAALVVLSACATLSEDQCRLDNWYEVGVQDGAKGRPADFILQHAKACNQFGIAPKAGPWREGRTEGLKQYCTASNAYSVGRRGQRLAPVCSGDNLERLQTANERGLQWHDIQRRIRDAESQIASINSDLAELAADAPGRASLISRRSFLRLEILRLRARQARFQY
jgi:hypothetical protein